MSSTPDAGPVVPLAWEPLSAAPIWEGPAAAARGTLEQGTYFAPEQIVGITGEGVLVTDENTGRSAYFLTTADMVEQHMADLSYQVMTVLPDASEWAAPGIIGSAGMMNADVAAVTWSSPLCFKEAAGLSTNTEQWPETPLPHLATVTALFKRASF